MKSCSVEGCEGKYHAKGYCQRHYKQVERTGGVLGRDQIHRDPVCTVEGCERKHWAKGYCQKHYKQVEIHGCVSARTRCDLNEIIIKGSVAEVILYDKRCKEQARAVIDTEHIEKVQGYKWFLQGGYVVTAIDKMPVGIQHIIMGVTPSRVVQIDHKDRNRLINLRSNLRSCTPSQNACNHGRQKNNTSGYKGVSKRGTCWQAEIMKNNRSIYLGSFKDRTEAAIAYNKAALKYHGEFAYFNEV